MWPFNVPHTIIVEKFLDALPSVPLLPLLRSPLLQSVQGRYQLKKALI
jgi:hypothetical protein